MSNPPRRAVLTLEPVMAKLEQFQLFETSTMMYLVGSDGLQRYYRMLKMDKRVRVTYHTKLSEVVREDDMAYDKTELKETLAALHEGNIDSGGLRLVAEGCGVVGFVKFIDCYYLILVTERREVGSIGSNVVYGIKNTEMFPIKDAHGDGKDKRSSLQQIWSRVNSKLNPTPRETAEARYVSLFQFQDLTKDFYFSYSYDLTNHLQHNMLASTSKTFPPPPCKDMFQWNHYLTAELEGCVGVVPSYYWVLPIIHGAYIQRRCSIFGRMITVVLIARRSRHFAGPRYLKRGVSDTGKVANDVEIEQVVGDECLGIGGDGPFSSFVQMRGSVPTFWSQDTSMITPKPPIVISRLDPTYECTQLHMRDLFERYSSPVIVLNLVKQAERKQRETIIGREFQRAIEYINVSIPMEKYKIRYCALDFSAISRSKTSNLLKALEDVARWVLDQTGYFCSDVRSAPEPVVTCLHTSTQLAAGLYRMASHESTDALDGLTENAVAAIVGEPSQLAPRRSASPGDTRRFRESDVFPGGAHTCLEQSGVVRTNCIDSLDRTNVAQFVTGLHALGRQMAALGLLPHTSHADGYSGVELGSAMTQVFMDMFTHLGDVLALQYGGSETNKRVATETADASQQQASTALNKHKELLTTIRRYYSNAFTDRAKQDAMNLFLGHYVPRPQDPPLWELESDYFLHNTHVQRGGVDAQRRYRWKRRGEESYDDIDSEGAASSEVTSLEPDGKRLGGPPSEELAVVHPLDDEGRRLMKQQERRRTLEQRKRRVRKRCERMQAELCTWLVEALHYYDQRRMWMQLRPPSHDLASTRFERRYQLNQLTEFDDVFSKPFNQPIPVATHLTTPTTPAKAVVRKASSSSFLAPGMYGSGACSSSEDLKSITIGRYFRDISSRARSMLRLGSRTMLSHPLAQSTPHSGGELSSSVSRQGSDYVGGSGGISDEDRAIFNKHVEPVKTPESVYGRVPVPEDPAAVAQYHTLLKDVLLDPSNVAGVKELQETACISQVLSVGPYQGLDQHVDLASVVFWVQRMVDKLLSVTPLHADTYDDSATTTPIHHHVEVDEDDEGDAWGYVDIGVEDVVVSPSASRRRGVRGGGRGYHGGQHAGGGGAYGPHPQHQQQLSGSGGQRALGRQKGVGSRRPQHPQQQDAWRHVEAILREQGLHCQGVLNLISDLVHAGRAQESWYAHTLSTAGIDVPCDPDSVSIYQSFYDDVDLDQSQGSREHHHHPKPHHQQHLPQQQQQQQQGAWSPTSPMHAHLQPHHQHRPSSTTPVRGEGSLAVGSLLSGIASPPSKSPVSVTHEPTHTHSLTESTFFSNGSADEDGLLSLLADVATTGPTEMVRGNPYFDDIVQSRPDDYFKRDNPWIRFNRAAVVGFKPSTDMSSEGYGWAMAGGGPSSSPL